MWSKLDSTYAQHSWTQGSEKETGVDDLKVNHFGYSCKILIRTVQTNGEMNI